MTRPTVPVYCIISSTGITKVTGTEMQSPHIRDHTVEDENLITRILNSEQHVHDVIGHICSTAHLDKLEKVWILGGTAVAATDGGLKDDIGSHGYKLVVDGEHDPIIAGYNAEETFSNTMTSTREEVLGMLAILYVLKICHEKYGDASPSFGITMVTDSTAALKIRFRNQTLGSNSVLGPEMDVESELRRVQNLIRIFPNVIWTRSHADPEDSENPYYTQLNNDPDKLTTEARDRTLDGTLLPVVHLIFPGTKASLATKNGFLIHNIRIDNVRRYSNWNTMNLYLCEKCKWSDEVFSSINWEALRRALRFYKPLAQPGIIKMMHKWQHNNVWRDKMSKSDDIEAPCCKRCGEPEENGHDFICGSACMKKLRYNGWRVLKTKMKSITSDTVLDKMWYGFHALTNSHEYDHGPEYSQEERSTNCCFAEQTRIGWVNFMHRRISSSWGIVNAELLYSKRRIDPDVWTSRLIYEVWRLSLSLWYECNEHEHGNKWSILLDERIAVYRQIHKFYQVVKPIVSKCDWVVI